MLSVHASRGRFRAHGRQGGQRFLRQQRCVVGDTIRTSIPTFYHGAMDDKVMREAERAMSDESYPPELQSVIIDIKDAYQSS